MRYETQVTDRDPDDMAKVDVHEAGHAVAWLFGLPPSSGSISTWQRKRMWRPRPPTVSRKRLHPVSQGCVYFGTAVMRHNPLPEGAGYSARTDHPPRFLASECRKTSRMVTSARKTRE